MHASKLARNFLTSAFGKMLGKIVVHSMEKKRLRSLMIVADIYGGHYIVENRE
jgi:hypothetical protein